MLRLRGDGTLLLRIMDSGKQSRPKGDPRLNDLYAGQGKYTPKS